MEGFWRVGVVGLGVMVVFGSLLRAQRREGGGRNKNEGYAEGKIRV